jgi:hypothetical protein
MQNPPGIHAAIAGVLSLDPTDENSHTWRFLIHRHDPSAAFCFGGWRGLSSKLAFAEPGLGGAGLHVPSWKKVQLRSAKRWSAKLPY